MSRQVDERVVEMRFDNDQFEKGVQQSVNSLNELNRSLSTTTAVKGLQDVEKAMNNITFDKMAGSLAFLEKRFSTLGIVGMRVTQNLTDKAMGFIGKAFSFVKSGIVQGGINRAKALEDARFMLQGIVDGKGEAKLKKVNAIMDQAQKSVKGTAYGYGDAASAAAQFVASGLKASQLESPLRAITGVAATTNASYESIAQIFTTVAGNGRLMGQQLVQLSTRSLNAAASIAKYVNANKDAKKHLLESAKATGKNKEAYKEISKHAKLTEKDIRTLVSMGAVDFKTFSNAMDDAFGEHAKDANKTFSGVMSNIKAALSRVGVDFVSPFIKQEGPLIKFLNVVMEKIDAFDEAVTNGMAKNVAKNFNKVINSMTKALKNADFSNFYAIVKNIATVISGISRTVLNVLKPIKSAFKESFKPSEGLKTFTDILAVLFGNIEVGEKSVRDIKKSFKGLFNLIKLISDPLMTIMKDVSALLKGGQLDIMGKIIEYIFAATASAMDMVSKVADAIEKTGIIQNIYKVVVATLKKAKDIVDNIGSVFDSIASNIGTALNAVGAKIGEFIHAFSFDKMFSSIIDGLKAGFEQLDFSKTLDYLNLGFFAGLIFQFKKFIERLEGPKEILNSVVGDVSSVFDEFKNALKTFAKSFDSVKKTLDTFRETLKLYQAQLKAGILLEIGAAIMLLAMALTMISAIDGTKMVEATGIIAVLFVALATLMENLNKLESIKNPVKTFRIVGLLLGASVAVLILAKAVKTIAACDVDKMFYAFIIVGALLGSIGIFADKVEPKGLTKAAIGMIALSIAMLILSKAFKQFGDMDIEKIGKGLLGFGTTLGALMVLMHMMPEDSVNLVKVGAGLLLAAVGIKVLASAIGQIAKYKGEDIKRSMLAIVGALTALSIALLVMQGTLGASAALMVATTALAGLVGVLFLVSKMDVESLVKSLTALFTLFAIVGTTIAVLKGFVVSLLLFSVSLTNISLAIIGIGVGLSLIGGGLLLVGAGIVAVATALFTSMSSLVASLEVLIIGFIKLIPKIATSLVDGLLSIVDAIAAAAPHFATSLLEMFVQTLRVAEQYIPTIADLMLSFLIKIINVVAQRTPELIEAFANLIKSVFSSLVKAFGDFDSSSFLQGVEAFAIMSVLVYVLSSIAGMIPAAMLGLAGVGALVAELGLILAAIGKLSEISGLTWFINQGADILGAIGNAIGAFIGGIAGGAALYFSSNLPAIADQLSIFMTNLKPFIEGASRINPTMSEGIKSLAAAVLMLTGAGFLDSISKWLTGGVDLGEFAAQLVPFGKGMKEYAASVEGINAKAITASATAAKAITELAKNIPNSGGLLSFAIGDNDLGTFARKLVPFGEAMVEYSNAVAGLSVTGIQNAKESVKALVETVNSTKEVDTSGVSSFTHAVKQLAKSSAKEMVSTFSDRASNMQRVGKQLSQSMSTGLAEGKEKLESTASSMVSGMSKALTSSSGNMRSSGKALINAFITGIKQKQKSAMDSMSTFMSAVLKVVTDYEDDFYRAGENAATGFSNGLKSNESKAVAAAGALADAALAAAKRKLKEKSPSRKFYEVGDYAVQGFVNALNDGNSTSARAGSDLAQKSLSAFSKAINSANDIVTSDINPTITPNIDLSNVRAGTNEINSLLSTGANIGVGTNIGSVGVMMNRMNQNGVTNGDIVDAIKRLNNNLQNVGNTYNSINGVTYDDGSSIYNAISEIANAALVERRS